MAGRVALLRAVNVGGRKLAMADLRTLAEGLGWGSVATYVASGNLLFDAAGDSVELALMLREALAAEMAMDVPVLVLDRDDMDRVLTECPFALAAGSHVHGHFCRDDPLIDRDALARLAAADEQLVARGRCVWLYAPSGVGRSKLANRIGQVIDGTDFTARNLNTIRALTERMA